uniref:Uncharacterized protein n=1 Tax=Arundo donax TaxID=35708 RepID=A0A0A9A1L5_ARUDO
MEGLCLEEAMLERTGDLAYVWRFL